MAKMTLEKLGIMIKEGFDKADERFVSIETRLDKLERGQEEIVMKLDNKADKIDFPEVYPEFRKPSTGT